MINEELALTFLFLFELESVINLQDEEGFTPLMWAAAHGQIAVVEFLLQSVSASYTLATFFLQCCLFNCSPKLPAQSYQLAFIFVSVLSCCHLCFTGFFKFFILSALSFFRNFS